MPVLSQRVPLVVALLIRVVRSAQVYKTGRNPTDQNFAEVDEGSKVIGSVFGWEPWAT